MLHKTKHNCSKAGCITHRLYHVMKAFTERNIKRFSGSFPNTSLNIKWVYITLPQKISRNLFTKRYSYNVGIIQICKSYWFKEFKYHVCQYWFLPFEHLNYVKYLICRKSFISKTVFIFGKWTQFRCDKLWWNNTGWSLFFPWLYIIFKIKWGNLWNVYRTFSVTVFFFIL